VANGIFVQRDFSIRNEYKDVVESVYQSEIRRLDFRREPQQAAKHINE
jgi:serine protease inhibitor